MIRWNFVRRHCGAGRRRDADSGFALPTVLWIVIALALLATGILHISRTDQRLARGMSGLAQARAAADAGIARGVIALLDREPAHAWRLDGTAQRWSFAGAAIDIAIEDEFGKIDLNAASDGLLHDLLRANGVVEREATALVDRIAGWRAADDPKHLDDAYRTSGYPYGPRKGAFESVDELGQVIGMTAELLARLTPSLTVFSRLPMPDPTTAPRAVLLVLPGIGAADADAALAARAIPTSHAGATPGAAPGTNLLIADLTGRAFTIRARARTDDGAEAVRSAVVRFSDGAKWRFWIQDWNDGS